MENTRTLSGLNVTDFVKKTGEKETKVCVLANSKGVELMVLNYGARIVSLVVPDKNGKGVDVVTGHLSIDEYLQSQEPNIGAICGRYANRIANGRFELDGVVFDQLAVNNGPNHLHGGIQGFNAVVWDMEQKDAQTVTLTYTSADGEEGFPGTLTATVVYHLSDKNEVSITYQAVTDKPTVLNLTNHAYFNLSGAGDPSVDDHLLTLYADYYLPVDSTAIPYGAKAEVAGTPMDFRTPHAIGLHINEPFEQLIFGKGYDHTYILNKAGNELSPCAWCCSPKTGIVMEVFTTEPGVQLYTGNWMTGNFTGKHGQRYPQRAAVCLETQHFPDSPNKPDYPTTVLRPGETFNSQTIFQFSVE
jgi:aldose 1-epimerase